MCNVNYVLIEAEIGCCPSYFPLSLRCIVFGVATMFKEVICLILNEFRLSVGGIAGMAPALQKSS